MPCSKQRRHTHIHHVYIMFVIPRIKTNNNENKSNTYACLYRIETCVYVYLCLFITSKYAHEMSKSAECFSSVCMYQNLPDASPMLTYNSYTTLSLYQTGCVTINRDDDLEDIEPWVSFSGLL